MNGNTKWRVRINQRYKDGDNHNRFTMIIELCIKANSASDAVRRASAWLLGEGTEDAFVGDVCCLDIREVDSGE